MPTTSSSSSSSARRRTVVAALLTTRRGIVVVSVAVLTVYFVLFHSSSGAQPQPQPGAVRGWAREYWNSAKDWTAGGGSGTRGRDESLGDLKRLKQEKHRVELEHLQRTAQGGHVEAEPAPWRKVHPDGDGDGDDEYAPAVEYYEEQGGERGSGRTTTTMDVTEAALADSPRVAIADDEALNRAPMAALGSSTTTTTTTASDDDGKQDPASTTTDGKGAGLADHAAAKMMDSSPPYANGAHGEGKQNADSIRGGGDQGQGGGAPVRKPKPKPPKPKPKPVAADAKKIGTGGKVVKPEQILGGGVAAAADGGSGHQAKVAGAEGTVPGGGGGEKAGKVVQAEAGRRVGTGARPGAKGMGLERVDGIGSERRKRSPRFERW
ncbi:hypothetical protein JCM11491_003449 [Sporobolomyces phaffii]